MKKRRFKLDNLIIIGAYMLVYVLPRMKTKMEFGEGLLRHRGSDWPALLEESRPDHDFAPIPLKSDKHNGAGFGCEDPTPNFGCRERGTSCISFVSFSNSMRDDEARSVERGTEKTSPHTKSR
jgi:hypothetical protein